MSEAFESEIGEKFDTVLKAERSYIDAWRGKADRTDRPLLTGLALSGGGIRSAVFCLGVIQALAKHEVLRNFDYLSTVSGGGYVGSSLTWFTTKVPGFGVDPGNLPYGIDDPAAPPSHQVVVTPLMGYLRRHGSYLDPHDTMSPLSGVSVALRGVVLNLLVIWLPIVTALMVAMRSLYRATAYCWTITEAGTVWLQPWMVPAAFATLFAVSAVVYSLYSGVRAARHESVPYRVRRVFERSAPELIYVIGFCALFGSLPYVFPMAGVLGGGSLGSLMSAAGAALGVWSRLVPTGNAAAKMPAWIGPIAAALVLYGTGLLAYALSGLLFTKGHVCPTIHWWTVIPFIIALGVGYWVDLNETTLHRFYRDRLMEAFMPDMNAPPDPPGPGAVAADTGLLCDMGKNVNGPYHLVNAHLVLTKVPPGSATASEVDKWRNRGGDSFVFAPRFCGGRAAGWHDTRLNKAFSNISLATAMAASGAAVNPDAASSGVGPERNWFFAVLMALLNIRLGYWLPNPTKAAGRRHVAAPNHFNPGLKSVVDRLSRTNGYLEITDGGHFENLGVYELLHRGVRKIVVCDATADPETTFADLQNLLSRAEADFNVTITLGFPPLGPLMPSTMRARFPLGVPFAKEPFVQGKIHYPSGPAGDLYYIKPTIFDGLRLNVLGFKAGSSAFPNDSTVDQFFDEARFEAYRELGFECVERLLKAAGVKAALLAM